MSFISSWITTAEFFGLEPIDIFKTADVKNSDITNYHTYFKKSFALDRLGDCIVRISADDYYKLYINGEFVAQGPAPAYNISYNYNEINISPYLKCGDNIIAVHVYYQGLVNRVWQSADNRQGMIADIFMDGEYLFGTDSSWKYIEAREFKGTTIGYDTAYLENINFNLKEKDRKISPPSDKYRHAVVLGNHDYVFAKEPVPCLSVYKALPKEVTKLSAGKYFIDFGTEITGQFYMKQKGEKGQTVIIKCGEETEKNDPKKVRYKMRCNCEYLDKCILSGGVDEFEFYDYKAFRFVSVESDIDNLDPSSFSAIVRHYPFEDKLPCNIDDERLKAVLDICKNGVKYGTQELFLDCPSREKGQYIGDFTVTGLAHLYITRDPFMYKKALRNFADSAKIFEGLLSVSPCTLRQYIADQSLQYPLQILNYYNFTGDKEIISELFPVVEGLIRYFEKYENSDGLIENCTEMWNLVDWPDNLRDGYCIDTSPERKYIPVHNVINSFYIGAVKTTARLAELIGQPDKYSEKIAKLERAFISAFYNEAEKLFCDDIAKTHSALHSNVLPLFFGIAPEESHSTIRDFIMQKGLSCGVQFSYFVLKALAKIGAYDEEYRLIVNDSEHSWLNMIREGATTCFEAWGKDQKWNTSLCHPWAASPVIAFAEDICNAVQKPAGLAGAAD